MGNINGHKIDFNSPYRFKESLSSFPFQQLLVPESKFDILIEE